MSRPIAFMVMPFQKKRIDGDEPGVPSDVDFDALWTNVHQPVLEELGYQAVRADADLGALIINETIQRLVIADLVVADITLANANVYYEIGVRHAARKRGCVLVGADWARPVFDLAQMRRLSFPMPDGACGPDAAAGAREALLAGLEPLTLGRSPVHEAVPGYPDVGPGNRTAFTDLVDALSGYQRDIAVIAETADPAVRRDRTLAMLGEYGSRDNVRDTVAVQIVELVRDHVGPEETLRYIESLPSHLQGHPPVVEQKQIALTSLGDVEAAVVELKSLIRQAGPGSDRYGILGGRYKKLMLAQEVGSAPYRRYLDEAIDAYERGMAEDLNDYYPSSNLPRLYRRRGRPGDEERAVAVATVVMAACTRTLERDGDDGWVLLTLLGAAFDRGDGAEAQRLAQDVERSTPALFRLRSTMGDLQAAYDLQTPAEQAELAGPLEFVRSLLPQAGP